MEDESIRPHTAVINCMLEIHSLLNTGECSGRKVSEKILNENSLKSNFILAVSGFDRNDCIRKLQERIAVFYEGISNDNVE